VRFEKLADTLHPADSEAFTWLMNAQEGDTIAVKVGKRTSQQNRALHKYLSLLADALGAAGFDMRTFPWKEGLSIPFTQASVKEHFWKPVQEAMFNKTSTRELDRREVNQVYEALDRAMSERVGVHVEFPNAEN
jgi:hypothetical protein